ncbi:hypothetical protein IMCC3317_47140 [Kordia antarctica]|uniref:UspA domain-containing protein n=1 Tax=Kordia antarctica TaxID=1218801 RepID=A0A7L4ZW57_9FLAO|nr:universal stress protein [Kordia antarctica]QHI39304.1 hypothetical protein IMCC3317_47140 [Kordia antarctica]
MKRILIPIDFTFDNYNTIDYAINFFKEERCEFYFLNTYSYEINGLSALKILQSDEDWYDKPRLNSEKKLADIRSRYKLKNKKHSYENISACINPIEGIKETIKNFDIDLVVVTSDHKNKTISHGYTGNVKNIIESVRECLVMIVPQPTYLKEHPEFILASSFEIEIPITELEKWYELVRIVNGSVKVVVLANKKNRTSLQIENQTKIHAQLETLSGTTVTVDYLETPDDLKKLAENQDDCIISLIDKKPNFWRKHGLSQSKITKLGPLHVTPLIALHS